MSNARLFLSRSILAAALCAPALAQENVLTPERVAELRSATSAQMSPDGKHIAWLLAVPRKPMVDDDGASWSELHVIDLPEGRSRPFVTGKVDVSAPAWLPDSSGIAFLAKRGDDKHAALYVIPLAGGEAARAASLSTAIASYSLAGDGKRAALVASAAEDESRKKEQDKGFKQEIYEEDWRPQEVWIANLFDASATPRKLAIDGTVTQVRWSPVDDRLLVAIAPTSLVDDEMMRQRVAIVDAGSGKELARFEHQGKLGALSWSPDGARIAAIGGADIHDPSTARLFVAASGGGALVELCPKLAADFVSVAWADATNVMCVVQRGVWTSFDKLDVAAKDAQPKTVVAPGGPVMTSVSLSKDGQRGAFVASTPKFPGEVFAMKHGDAGPARLTNSNPWLDSIALAAQEVFAFKARDGLALEGVLVRPLAELQGKRYPLILAVHGGPEACVANGWTTSYSNPGQMAAAKGFAVFYPNYRGSTGRGVEFAELGQGDAAGKEFDDLVDAVDRLIEANLVDKDKVGITGGSYGGYATAWCCTRFTERFAAGVMFVGISDLVSKSGTTDIPEEEFLVHALRRPWEDWQQALERSPIAYAGQCRTPLLILGGKDDPRVHPGQSRELYRYLKLQSKSPVRLVLYPGEGHGNRKAASRFDYSLRMMQWFEQYLQGAGGAPPPFDLDYAKPADAPDAGATSKP